MRQGPLDRRDRRVEKKKKGGNAGRVLLVLEREGAQEEYGSDTGALNMSFGFLCMILHRTYVIASACGTRKFDHSTWNLRERYDVILGRVAGSKYGHDGKSQSN